MTSVLESLLQAQWFLYGASIVFVMAWLVWSAANDKPDKDDDYE